METFLGTKSKLHIKLNCAVGKNVLAKSFFVIMDVYFQNMAIKNCDCQRLAVIKPQKLIV